MQLINASETSWKKLLKGQKTNLMMVSLYDQHLTTKSSLFVNRTISNEFNGERNEKSGSYSVLL